MKCKNPYCKGLGFSPVVNFDNNRLVGVTCVKCGAIYAKDELEIKKSVNREGMWNTARWVASTEDK